MKLISVLLLSLCGFCFGGESYFFEVTNKETKPELSIDGKKLKVAAVMNIKRVEPPKVQSISAFHQGLGEGRKFQVQVNLVEAPKKRWRPAMKLGEDILVYGVRVSRPDEGKFASSFSLETDDEVKLRRWVKILQGLFGLADEKVEVDLEE